MKLLTTIFLRGKAMLGGVGVIIFLVISLFFGFWVANHMTRTPSESVLRIGLMDFDESRWSKELVAELYQLEGIVLTIFLQEEEALIALAKGNEEGILWIGEGYGAALEAGENLPLVYDGSATATSQTAAREMIAGQVITQRSMRRAYRELEERALTVSEDELRELLSQFQENAHPLYRFTFHYPNDARVSAERSGIFAGYMGFVGLVIMLVLMTLSQWFTWRDSKLVVNRMMTIPFGRSLSFLADIILLLGIGSVIIVLAYIGMDAYAPREWAYLFAYLYCVVGICLLLSKVQEAGSIDVMAPMIALGTSILGGTFMDLSSLSPTFRALSYFTPQGQMLHGINQGRILPLLVLLTVGTVFLLICIPQKKG